MPPWVFGAIGEGNPIRYKDFDLPKNRFSSVVRNVLETFFDFDARPTLFLKNVSNRFDMREAIADHAVLSPLRYRRRRSDSNCISDSTVYSAFENKKTADMSVVRRMSRRRGYEGRRRGSRRGCSFLVNTVGRPITWFRPWFSRSLRKFRTTHSPRPISFAIWRFDILS